MDRWELFKIVKKEVDAFDAYGLLAGGCPDDEFDNETSMICARLKKGMRVEEIAQIISDVMCDQFEAIFKRKEFLTQASAIKKALELM